MKHLPKHLQPRWRYLAVVVESWGDTTVSRDAFQRQVWYAAQNLLGDAGAADADLTIQRFTATDGVAEAVVRVRRGETTAARAAVACVSRIDGEPVGVAVRGISGTIRACVDRWFDTPREERYIGTTGGVTRQERVTVGDRSVAARVRRDRVDLVPADESDGRVGATRADVTED